MSTPHARRGQRTWAPSDFCSCPLCGHTTVLSHYHLMDVWASPRFGPSRTMLCATAAGVRCEHMSSSALTTAHSEEWDCSSNSLRITCLHPLKTSTTQTNRNWGDRTANCDVRPWHGPRSGDTRCVRDAVGQRVWLQRTPRPGVLSPLLGSESRGRGRLKMLISNQVSGTWGCGPRPTLRAARWDNSSLTVGHLEHLTAVTYEYLYFSKRVQGTGEVFNLLSHDSEKKQSKNTNVAKG